MCKALSDTTTVEEWLNVLVAEVDILDEPGQIMAGEIYTLLAHRDELQAALGEEISEVARQQVEEIDRHLLQKAEVIASAEDLARRREQRSRGEGLPVSAWWWHLDEILAGLRYLRQAPELPRKEALVALFPEAMRVTEKPLPLARERRETYDG